MIFTLTIAGVSNNLKAGSLSISKTANGRTTASFTLLSENRSYRPALDAEVLMTEDGTRILGGLVDRPRERGMFNGSHPGIVTTVSVVDFNVYPERRFVEATFPAQTLKARLQTIVTNYLSVYGVTLNASQVDGPTLPEVAYERVRLDAVLNEQVTLTADVGQPFVWAIDYFKVLRAYQPSTVAAPFNLVGNTLAEAIGDIEVETSRGDDYANKIIIRVQPKTEMGRVETFTSGTNAYPYVLQYTPFATRGYVTHATIFETLRLPSDPDPASWTLNGNTLTRDAGAPTAGQVTIINFDGTFSGEWTATDASWTTSPFERVVVLESIPSDTTGQAFADALLAKALTVTTTVTYTTWEQGIEPGQQQTVNVSARNVNATAVITDVVIRDRVYQLERFVTAVVDDAQTNLGRGWRDVYKLWAGDKTGGTAGAVAVGGATAAIGPGGPVTAVQYNDSGVFGGQAEFTWDKVGHNLVAGELSSITASAPNSCQCFGADCHITD